jgi:hypothetical protein
VTGTNHVATHRDHRLLALVMPVGRVGSNLLMGTMLQSRHVVEGVNEPTTAIQSECREQGWDSARRAELEREWVSQFVAIRPSRVVPAVRIVKLSYRSMQQSAEIAGSLAKAGSVVVRLDRRNTFKTALSMIRVEAYAAEHERRYGERSYGVRPGHEIRDLSVEVRVDRLFALMDEVEAVRRAMDEDFGEHYALRLYYEDILLDPGGVFEELCAQLSIPTFNYELPFVRMAGHDWTAGVQNAEQVKEGLCGTRYEQFL